ncbi:MAG: cytochrome c [Anaerolineae bacterium]|nr:cytochrome c [Anaerolineae bacterium]
MSIETPSPAPSTSKQTLYLVFGGFLVVGLLIVVVMIAISAGSGVRRTGVADADLTETTYLETVSALLTNADPIRGEQAIRSQGCLSCHGESAVAVNLAPTFEGIALTAMQRRPPLTASAYLYEAIVYPDTHLVTGYTTVMPGNYGDLPQDALGDMLAYLLTKTDGS